MELVINKKLINLSGDETKSVNGGFVWYWQAAVTIFAIAAGYNELYDLGYKVGSWFRK